jgi:hypothetical protein
MGLRGSILRVSHLEDPETKQSGIVEGGVLRNKERDKMAFWAGAALSLSGRVPVLSLEGDQQNQPQQRFPVVLPSLG